MLSFESIFFGKIMSRRYKGSIQKKEDLLWYSKNKKDFDKALRRFWVSKVLDWKEVYSRTGNLKELYFTRGQGMWPITYVITKRIKSAQTKYLCSIRADWNDYQPIIYYDPAFDTVEEAKEYVKYLMLMKETYGVLNYNIITNKPLFRKICEEVLGKII